MKNFALLALLAFCSCVDDDELGETDNELASSVGGVGPDGGIDWSIDAPWRMEPTPLAAGGNAYDPIPITITFHDADMQTAGEALPLHRFCGVDVLELQPGQTWMNGPHVKVDLEDFHEIEATLRWTAQGILTPTPPGVAQHVVRQVWNGDSVDDVRAINPWSEWHGTFHYTPQSAPSGNEVRLIILARISRFGGTCHPIDLNRWQLMYQLKKGKVSRYPWTPGPVYQTTNAIFFGDFLRVEYGSAPLPRFDVGWVYGDVHYHSQGTDNEGESALNFRGALAAMKAMGLDYAFATDHASAGTQVTGAGSLVFDNLPSWVYVAAEIASWFLDMVEQILDFITQQGVPIVERDALRDMNHEKFRTLRRWLNDPDGANAQVASWGTSWRAPQMFLGAEVDVIPELSNAEAARGYIEYAGGARYDVYEPCFAIMDLLEDLTNWEDICVPQMVTAGSSFGRKSIRDVQGTADIGHFARQHLVQLPTDPTDDDQIIIANTSTWGGATLSLKDVVEQHLGAQQKGVAFLAHPVDSAGGGHGAARLGPDMVPYSDAQLEVAFSSPHVLGLQLWNSDSRVTSSAPWFRPGSPRRFPFLDKIGVEDPELSGWIQSANLNWSWHEHTPQETDQSLRRGTIMWDQMSLWGITPSRTAAIGLAPGVYRKVYMAGGSDAHGDLNYRRNGRMKGVMYATDTRLGSPRNLTFVGSDRPVVVDDGGSGIPTVGQTQIVDALRTGRFSVTDGPALRIAIDRNGNGQIDPADAQMGEDFTLVGAASAPVLIEWKSTAEFGRVRELDLYVGAQAGSREGVVYAPFEHGPPAGAGEPCVPSEGPILDPEGNQYCPMNDDYVRDEQLRYAVPTANGYGGTVRIDVDPADFKLFDLTCTTRLVPAPVPDGEPPQWMEIRNCRVDRTQVAPRLFVRAFAFTDDTIDSFATHRYAYTNPVYLHARELPAPPTVSVVHASCSNDQNRFNATVTGGGGVSATLQRQWRIGVGSWTTLSSSSATLVAPAGQVVSVRARACNGDGCSGYALQSATGSASCPAPIPSPPKVLLEYTGCVSGQNRFAATVTAQGSVPATSIEKQKKIASGSWTTLTSTLITAGSGQTVYLRGRSCNANGCSSYAQTSKPGPTCSGGGGPLPP
jgi:hypothetical protein